MVKEHAGGKVKKPTTSGLLPDRRLGAMGAL